MTIIRFYDGLEIEDNKLPEIPFFVQCEDNNRSDPPLAIGATYKVIKVDKNNRFILDGLGEDGYFPKRFVLVATTTTASANPTEPKNQDSSSQPDVVEPTFDFDTYNSTLPRIKNQ